MSRCNASRNPWPAAIIGFFAVFISLAILFIVFAVRQRVDLVRADYYEDEMSYQRQIDRLQRTRPVQSEVGIAYDAVRQRLEVTLPPAHAEARVSGSIHLYRPSDAGLDREMELTAEASGSYLVGVANLKAGLWRVRLHWNANGEEYFFDQSIIVSANKS